MGLFNILSLWYTLLRVVAILTSAECLSPAELPAFWGESLSVFRARRNEATSRWLDYHLEGGR